MPSHSYICLSISFFCNSSSSHKLYLNHTPNIFSFHIFHFDSFYFLYTEIKDRHHSETLSMTLGLKVNSEKHVYMLYEKKWRGLVVHPQEYSLLGFEGWPFIMQMSLSMQYKKPSTPTEDRGSRQKINYIFNGHVLKKGGGNPCPLRKCKFL